MRLYTDREAAASLAGMPNRVQASDDPWEATHQTVQYMCQLVSDSLTEDPERVVQQATIDADRFRQFGRSPWASIWWWVKHKVKFVHHAKLLGQWIGAGDELQLLIRPDALLKMQQPKGDCAVFTTLVCAMLDAAGLPWEIVTVAVDLRQPGIFSHVYARVILRDGRRVPLDASHGKWPGWEVPPQAVSAKQVWDQNGNPIEDTQRFEGLHGLGDGFMYGMGQLPGETDEYTVDTSDLGIDTVPNNWAGMVDVSTPVSAPPVHSSMTPQTSNALASLASQLTSIFGQVVAPTTQVKRNADGSYSYVTPGSGTNAAALLPGGTAIGSSNLLLIGGLVVGGLLLVSMFAKK